MQGIYEILYAWVYHDFKGYTMQNLLDMVIMKALLLLSKMWTEKLFCKLVIHSMICASHCYDKFMEFLCLSVLWVAILSRNLCMLLQHFVSIIYRDFSICPVGNNINMKLASQFQSNNFFVIGCRSVLCFIMPREFELQSFWRWNMLMELDDELYKKKKQTQEI